MDREEAIQKIEYGLRMETSEMTPFGQLTVVRTDALKIALTDLRAMEDLENRLNENIGAAKMWCRRYHELARNSHDVAQACEWISVEERLPEDDPNVKKHIEGERFGFLTVLAYNGVVKQTNRFFCNEARYGLPKTNSWEWASQNVTHWMPIPEQPEEQK